MMLVAALQAQILKQVLSTVTLYGAYTGALTFENVCQDVRRFDHLIGAHYMIA
jgi:hypothetical protein